VIFVRYNGYLKAHAAIKFSYYYLQYAGTCKRQLSALLFKQGKRAAHPIFILIVAHTYHFAFAQAG
jgi:hypothetical protein